MSLPRFLTDYGLGYYRGGFPAAEFADDAAMLAQYPVATSAKLVQLGGADMLDYLPGQWTSSLISDTANLVSFTAASGATSVLDSRGNTITCPKPSVVYGMLAVGGGEFHPTLDSVGDWDGKFVQYNDESLCWYGLNAGMRARLWDRWSEFSATAPLNAYGLAERNLDETAYQCAVEGLTSVLSHMQTQLTGSRWAVHLMPVRGQTTSLAQAGNASALYDHNFGQWGNSSASRWRGVGASEPLATQADDYADFWLDVAREIYQPIANASGWLCPRLYIDPRMRNWDQEVPGQTAPFGWTNSATAALIRESYMLTYEDQVDLCKAMAPNKPLYPAVIPFHAVPGATATNDTSQMGWYEGLSVDRETHREQMSRIAGKANGVSYWSSEDYLGRIAFGIGRPQANPANAPAGGDVWGAGYNIETAEGGIIKTRLRIQRRFGLFTSLALHPATQAGEDAWRTQANWTAYNAACVANLERLAAATVLRGSAKQTTLASIRDGITPAGSGGGPVIGGG
jgi:hypothetical protein